MDLVVTTWFSLLYCNFFGIVWSLHHHRERPLPHGHLPSLTFLVSSIPSVLCFNPLQSGPWGHCCCSVLKLCPTLWDLMDSSMPGSSILHYLPEFAQIYVHWVGDANQPSHPLLPAFPFAFNLSQYQGLFQWVGSSHQVAKVLELWLQYQPLMNIVPVIFLLNNADLDQWNLYSFLLFLLFSGSFSLALMFCFKSTKLNGLAETRLSSDGDVKGQRL